MSLRVVSSDSVLSPRISTAPASAACSTRPGAVSHFPSASVDHDPLFRFHRWRAKLRVLDIEELKSVPFVPRSHPFIERLNGTLRREYLDQTFFWNGLDLHRKLIRFATYYCCVIKNSPWTGS